MPFPPVATGDRDEYQRDSKSGEHPGKSDGVLDQTRFRDLLSLIPVDTLTGFSK